MFFMLENVLISELPAYFEIINTIVAIWVLYIYM